MSAQPNKYDPALTYLAATSRAWASTGNTDTVTDDAVQASSLIVIVPNTAFAGRWSVVASQGSFVVTSSSSETATTTTYKYRVM